MKWDWQVRVKSVTNFLSHQQSLRNIWLFTPDMSAVFAKRLTEKKLTWANISNSNTRMHYHCQISLVSYAEDRAPLNRTWILTWSLFIQRKILKDIDVTSAKRDSWESVIWMCIWHSLIWLEKRNWKPMVLLSASIVLGHTKWRKSWRLMKGYILKKPFKCKFCDYCSNRKEYVNSHERTHTGEKPFACDICEQKFNHKSTLGIHILSHTGEKPFSCTICDTKFRQRPHLKSHMKLVHSGPEKKVFSCTICQKTFTTKDSLVKHQALHSTEKLFDCSVCPKSFKSKQHKSHRAVKNEIVCSICSNTFSKAAIKKHKEEVHYNIRTNKCGTCGQMFHRSSEMKKHMDKLHYLVSFEWNIQALVQNMFFFHEVNITAYPLIIGVWGHSSECIENWW